MRRHAVALATAVVIALIAVASLGSVAQAQEDELPPFECGVELASGESEAHALITDIQVGTHDGFDRITYSFENPEGTPSGLPEFRIREAHPPLTADPTGREMDVEGNRFVEIILIGGTAVDEDFEPVYEGPTEFRPGFPQLLELVERGDFEAVSSWYAGLEGEPCVRAFALADPLRLVVDVRHPADDGPGAALPDAAMNTGTAVPPVAPMIAGLLLLGAAALAVRREPESG